MAIKPLTSKIVNRALDASAVINEIKCPDVRRHLDLTMRKIRNKAERLHLTRLLNRSREDRGSNAPSDWDRRHGSEIDRLEKQHRAITEELERLELQRRPGPAQLPSAVR